MNHASAADDHPVAEEHVAAEGGAVGEDAAVADLAVVPRMGAGHEVVAAADRGRALL